MRLSIRIGRRSHRFNDLNDLLARANRDRSGDRLAKLAARSDAERIAARRLLAEVTLEEVRARPALPPEDDAISRIVEEDLDERAFARHRGKTVGELRDFILSADPEQLTARRLGFGLTPEMVAAVAKLCSNLDLVAAARRIPVRVRANTTLGDPDRLGVRIQPNHPTDDLGEILAQTAEGLAFGCGDALIGVNPARDDERTVRAILEQLQDLVDRHEVPTQVCVLAHVTTQMKALENGAPMGLMFQSLAGTEKACRAFGIDVSLLDQAEAMAAELCRVDGVHCLYFETGQGSELSSGTHQGIDQVTLEARCYGLARRYAPFAVNTVIGFIGPEYLYSPGEVQRAGLEDHFMGKLLGLPMGVDTCATNHMPGDQDDLENQALLLASAGANFFMGVPMGDDALLGYRTTSFHDLAALRETLGRRPAPEFERWLEARGWMENGRLTRRAGNGSRLFRGPKGPTTSRIGVGRAGTRPRLETLLEFQSDLAEARDAVGARLPAGLVTRLGGFQLFSAAKDHEQFLRDPGAGRRLRPGEAERVRRKLVRCDVQPVVLTGLSAGAVGEQAGAVLEALKARLEKRGLRVGRPAIVERGRVKLADEVGRLAGARIVVALVGDRPGLRAPRSLSAYVTLDPRRRTSDAQRTMVSNIHSHGLSSRLAAAQIDLLIGAALDGSGDDS